MADNRTSPLDGDSKSLAHAINAAISQSHTRINRLILDRMPRAVPPQTDTPSTYVTGLLHFGAVYVAFESLWQNILGISPEAVPTPYTYFFSHDPAQHDETPRITARTRNLLEQMYWPNMLRSARIRADIHALTGWPDHVVDEQLRSVGMSGRLGEFLVHIGSSVSARPHLLLAYAYSLYLAVLSGGSYIRTELMHLGPEFWQTVPTPIRPNMVECNNRGPGSEKPPRHDETSFGDDAAAHGLAGHDPTSIKMPLDFMDFDPPLGGNSRQQTKELKTEFKRRLIEAETALTGPEREDIIKESVNIFENLEGVVGQLDKICGATQGIGQAPRVPNSPQPSSSSSSSSSRTASIGSRLRDGIAVAKGRLLRSRRKPGGSSPVAATVPTMVEEDTASDANSPEVSGPSSLYSSPPEASLYASEPRRRRSELPRNAVLPPREGSRAIRHYRETRPDGPDSAYDDDVESELCSPCPRPRPRPNAPRVSTVRETAVKESPVYALCALTSNLAVLIGITALLAAYLYVRHEDLRSRPVEL